MTAISQGPAAMRPGAEDPPHIRRTTDGAARLNMMVEGVHCGGCVARIERALRAMPAVRAARVNLSTRRLAVTWDDSRAGPAEIMAAVEGLGYRAMPFDPELLAGRHQAQEKALLRAMAVAGFAAGNVMLLSVSVWAGYSGEMGVATRGLFHWLSALIALPAIAYAGQPFFASAIQALAAGRTNMDVPITLAILLATGMSLIETASGGHYVYFDSAVTLLFFLLVGRYLDSRARGRARAAAENLLGLAASSVTVLDPDGTQRVCDPAAVAPGAVVLVPAGQRIGVDGTVIEGASDVDSSLVTGESLPAAIGPGTAVFAGTLNLTATLRVRAAATGEDTLLAEIARLMEAAEQGRARFVALADRVARLYAPAVHSLAAITFLIWFFLVGAPWQQALLYAVAVLIITCPCALGLAVPAVQVIASGRLFRQGILLKSATALERLAQIDTIAFDKTGTLTLGRPALRRDRAVDDEALRAAASIAAASSHPLARALVAAAPPIPVAANVIETPGAGLAWAGPAGGTYLGSRAWCGVAAEDGSTDDGPELWFVRPGMAPVRFAFEDAPRPDAAAVVARLRSSGLRLLLLSGDRPDAVRALAERLGIADWRAGMAPGQKVARLEELAAEGRHVLMVGDGLNDAPSLAVAHVSLSPSSAAEISQNAADIVFQGDRLAPVAEALAVAGRAALLVRQNLALALLYNIVTVPLAMLGHVTPLVAAVAMSSSSLVVMGNALRLAGRNRPAGAGG
ncbi:MAG: heavy metal translocating P-type ATPase [Proteobacteria bacterium]|nr:heavy metal translocating P-type ATPase [Pseudomonadota bacterium]